MLTMSRWVSLGLAGWLLFSLADVVTVLSAQLVVRICALFVIFLFMWQTLVFQYGLLGILCNQFQGFFLITFLSLIFLIAFRAARVVSYAHHDIIPL